MSKHTDVEQKTQVFCRVWRGSGHLESWFTELTLMLDTMKSHLSIVAFGIALSIQSAHGQDSAYLDSFHCVGGKYGLELPKDARKLRSLDRLVREDVAEVEQWDGYTATRKTLYFDGLELGVVEISNDPMRVMITHALVTKPKWNHIVPFKLGRSIESAQALLGASAKGDGELKRSYGGESDSMQFQSESGVVVGVSYNCYSG